MSFIDSQNLFASAQALTATGASTNVIDLGVARNIFDGEPQAIVIVPTVSADFTTGDESYAVAIETATDAAFSSPVTILAAVTITAAKLAVGLKTVLPVPVGANVLQFIRLKWTLGGTTPSVTYEAYLQPLSMVEKVVYYKDNSPIS